MTLQKGTGKKINPKSPHLPDKDIEYIRNKIIQKVNSELNLRVSKGYKNINLGLVKGIVDELLKEINVI